MINFKQALYFMILLWVAMCKTSHAEDISFESIGVQDGLSQLSVMSIAQDQQGAMWFGTREGISYYDGFRVTPFMPLLLNKNRFGNIILEIFPVGKDMIYIVCDDNLLYYNIMDGRFDRVDIDNVQSISPVEDGVWVVTRDRIARVSGHEPRIEEYCKLSRPIVSLSGIPARPVSWIKQLSDGRLLLGNPDGLFLVAGKNDIRPILAAKNVAAIFEDNSNRIWVPTEGFGLFLLDKEFKTLHHFEHSPTDDKSISSNDVRAICQDNNGQIWIGTFSGLNLYNERLQSFSAYKQSDRSINGLTNNSIKALLCDIQGTVWIGSYYGAVNYFNPDALRFKFYPTVDKDNKTSGSQLVTKIVEEANHNIYIATDGSGVLRRDNTNGALSRLTHEQGALSHNSVRTMYLDSVRNHLYIGSHFEGLDVVDLTTRRLIKHYSTNNGLSNNSVYSLSPRGNELFISTQNQLFVLDMTDGRLAPLAQNIVVSKDRWINPLFLDRRGNLWSYCVGESQVHYYDFSSSKGRTIELFSHSRNPISIVVTDIIDDSHGNLWFATNGMGVFRYSPTTDSIVNYTAANSTLLSDYCYSLGRSPQGNIFVSTNKGLSIINVSTNQIVGLSVESSPLSAVNQGNGIYVTSTGEVFWGGTNGVATFMEQQIHNINKPTVVYFSSLEVNNRVVTPQDLSKIASKTVGYTPKIKLRTTDININIWFGTTNYVKSNSCVYQYRIVGINNKWQQCEGNKISLLSLNRGHYKLQVRGMYSYNNSFSNMATLEIDVRAPFYLSYTAILVYLLLLVAGVYYLIHSYARQLKLRSLLATRQREKEQIETVNRSKLQFFTNISHEFRTPLMLITAQLESLADEDMSKSFWKKVNSVHQNAIKMNDLLTELLDFRKQEQGFLQIHIRKVNFVKYVTDLLTPFNSVFEQLSLKISLIDNTKNDTIYIDPKQFSKVINNLTSNAIKYSVPNSQIKVTINDTPESISIAFSNRGKPIPEKYLDAIFDPFFRVEEHNHISGAGIGLAVVKGIVELHHAQIWVKSSPEEDTTFCVTIKKGDSHFSPAEKAVVKNKIESYFTDINSDTEVTIDQPAKQNESPLTNINMLIVEDNLEIQSLLAQTLSQFYNVKIASNGYDALEIISQAEPDIIVTDLMMPQMNGMELLLKLKNNLKTSHIPVVMITADATEQTLLESLQYGADDYIIKPLSIKHLIARCNNIIRNRHSMQHHLMGSSDTDFKTLAHNRLDYEFIKKVQNVIEKNIENELFSIDQIANELSINRKNVYAKIKSITGMTPNDMILNIRLKRSVSLLIQSPEMTIAEIAYKMGFNTPQYFSKCFKGYYGQTPTEYRSNPTKAAAE